LRAGYSLLEVLVAFTIMAGVLAVLLPAQMNILRRASGGEEAFLAASYAQSRIDRLGVSDPILAGISVDTYRDWLIETDILFVEGRDDIPAHALASVKVKDDTGRLLATLKTIKLMPR